MLAYVHACAPRTKTRPRPLYISRLCMRRGKIVQGPRPGYNRPYYSIPADGRYGKYPTSELLVLSYNPHALRSAGKRKPQSLDYNPRVKRVTERDHG